MLNRVDIYSGSSGLPLVIETGRDLSNTTSLRLRIRNPKNNNNDRELTRDFIVNPEKGTVVYVTQQKDFPIPGQYKIQLFDETGGKIECLTEILRVKIKPSLDFVETRKSS